MTQEILKSCQRLWGGKMNEFYDSVLHNKIGQVKRSW
jgi:hypothetical protein